MNYQKNIIKFGKKLKNSLKKEFDSDLVYSKIYLKGKIIPITEKSTQTFTTIKFQNKILDIFAYQ